MRFKFGITIPISLLISLWGAAASAIYVDGMTERSRFSFDQLEVLLRNPKAPKTLEETLAVIEKKAPDLFAKYVLMYRSKSLQASSFENPRAIVFTPDASFVMTYNGDGKHRGNNTLEIMQFRGDRFEFREVEFTTAGAKISEPNPKSCMRCHQSAERRDLDPRPNWEPYSIWPGAYGSESVGFAYGRNLSTDPLRDFYNAGDNTHLKEVNLEKTKLIEFLEKKNSHPRYQFLKDLGWKDVGEATTSFTQALGELNFHRVVRLAREDSHYKKVKYLLAGVIRCGKFFVDEPKLSAWEKLTPNEKEEFVGRKGELMRERTRKPYVVYSQDAIGDGGQHTIYPEKYPYVNVSEGLYLLFQPFGRDITDWSMDFQSGGRLAFRERFGLPANVSHAIQQAYSAQNFDDEPLSCDQIQEKALAESRALEIPQAIPELSSAQPLINRCIGCHVDEGHAPYIPFHNPQALKNLLGKPSGKWGSLMEDIEYRLGDHATLDDQMPKGLGRVRLTERRKLIEYFKAL